MGNFIEQQLQRIVEDMQPCLFGTGLFQMRSRAARFALVQNGPYEIQENIFVRFVNHDNRTQLHKSAIAFTEMTLI